MNLVKMKVQFNQKQCLINFDYLAENIYWWIIENITDCDISGRLKS